MVDIILPLHGGKAFVAYESERERADLRGLPTASAIQSAIQFIFIVIFITLITVGQVNNLHNNIPWTRFYKLLPIHLQGNNTITQLGFSIKWIFLLIIPHYPKII